MKQGQIKRGEVYMSHLLRDRGRDRDRGREKGLCTHQWNTRTRW